MSTKLKKRLYSWPQLVKDCLIISKKLSAQNFDCLVAISRGGLIPATILSYLLDIKKIHVIGYDYYLKPGVRGKLKRISLPGKNIKNCHVLLVDEKADTGNTLSAATQFLKKEKNKVTSATLHWEPKSKIKPDYFVHRINDVWIVYPWDESLKKKTKGL